MKVKRRYFVFAVLLMSFYTAQEMITFLPKHFPEPRYDFSRNLPDEKVIELGRALFFDPLLSKDGMVSCASCHSPYNAFAHSDHALSHGVNDRIGKRNAPALFNLAWQKSFMWDGAINHLDMQPLAPMNHPDEMGETTVSILRKLRRSQVYQKLFAQAFNDSSITGERMLKALSQFQLTLVSADSKYDQVMNHQAEFTVQEENGYRLFKRHCNTCHTEPLFSNYAFANNGLPVDTLLKDYGKMTITGDAKDSLRFKIPSLRNLTYTLPYMHDGRFNSLQQVMNHYTSGIVPSATLSRALRQPIDLTANEKKDLIAFLLTLNDKKFVYDQKHQFPKEILLSEKNKN